MRRYAMYKVTKGGGYHIYIYINRARLDFIYYLVLGAFFALTAPSNVPSFRHPFFSRLPAEEVVDWSGVEARSRLGEAAPRTGLDCLLLCLGVCPCEERRLL